MAGTSEASADSRTSGVGRKRNLHEFGQYRGMKEDAAEDERTTKRVKDTSGIYASSAHGMVAAGDVEPLQALPAESKNISTNPIVTWNQGVQCGLRTSFASKNKLPSLLWKSAPMIDPTASSPSGMLGSESSVDVNGTDFLEASQNQSPLIRSRTDKRFATGESISVNDLSVQSKSTALISSHIEKPAKRLLTSDDEASNSYDSDEKNKEEHNDGEENEEDEDDEEGDEEVNVHSPMDDIKAPSDVPLFELESPLAAKFGALTSEQKHDLTSYDGLSYKLAADAYQIELKQREPIKKLAEAEKAASEDPSLANKALVQHYTKVLRRLATKCSRIEKLTKKAEIVLAQLGQWPMPEKYSEIALKITSGGTSYPREASPTYSKGRVTFKISEVLDERGMPIVAQEFSFSKFSLAFLKENRDIWDSIDQARIVTAFRVYVSAYYGHLIALEGLFHPVAMVKSPITVEQAKAQITKSFEAPSTEQGLSTQTSPMVYINDSDSSHENGPIGTARVFPDIPHSELTVVATQRDKSITNSSDIPMFNAVETTKIDSRTTSTTSESERMDFDLDEGEFLLQEKYFPSSKDTLSYHCLSCSRTGHKSSTCPSLSCNWCGTNGEHSDYMCPQHLRCGKCHELGHVTKNCPEKLARSKDEAVPCDRCGSRDHSEAGCHFIWRSFDPEPEDIRVVREIPVHCYCCGGSDHYGPECGLHRGLILSGGVTWSRLNLQKYLNLSSSRRALSAGTDFAIPGRAVKQFSIKGKANGSILLENSDNEEMVEFIRPRIDRPARIGQIHFGAPSQPLQEGTSYQMGGFNSVPSPLPMRSVNTGGSKKHGKNLTKSDPHTQVSDRGGKRNKRHAKKHSQAGPSARRGP